MDEIGDKEAFAKLGISMVNDLIAKNLLRFFESAQSTESPWAKGDAILSCRAVYEGAEQRAKRVGTDFVARFLWAREVCESVRSRSFPFDPNSLNGDERKVAEIFGKYYSCTIPTYWYRLKDIPTPAGLKERQEIRWPSPRPVTRIYQKNTIELIDG